MPASPLDSIIYRDLFGDAEIGQLFTDTAEIRAMLLVEGALAKAQGSLGVIPEVAAQAIHRASLEIQIDPGSLTKSTLQNGVPVPGLITAFREAMAAPEYAQFVHWGATSQDILDTGLALRLRQALAILDNRLIDLIGTLGSLAKEHSRTPMIARTWGQGAVPTSLGAVVASWGQPMIRHHHRLDAVRNDVACVSLSGAAGNLSAMDRGAEIRQAMAENLGLNDPGHSRHATRDGQMALAGWLAGLSGSLGKFAEDVIFLSATGINEITLSGTGASSTMPQKSNPVAPSSVVALSRLAGPLASAIQSAGKHTHQRDGAAWMVEWLTLQQLVLATSRALLTACNAAKSLAPNSERMAANIEATKGSVFAEALVFALAREMGRPEAQAVVKSLVSDATTRNITLSEAAMEAYPDQDLSDVFSAENRLGAAPSDAQDFAAAAAELQNATE